MAFKAEELTTKVFPDSVLWAGCPQDTMSKGKPCQEHTKKPCTQNSAPPDGGGGHLACPPLGASLARPLARLASRAYRRT